MNTDEREVAMRTMLMILLLGVAGLARAQDPPAEQKQRSNTVYAERRLVIDRAVANHAMAAIQSPRTLQPLAKRIAGTDQHDVVRMALGASRSGEPEVTITVDLTRVQDARPAAAELADAVVKRIEQQLREPYLAGLRHAEQRQHQAQRKLDELTARLQESRQAVQEATGRMDASTAAIREQLTRMENQRQELRLDVVAKQARRDALTRKIAELTKEAAQRAQEDPVVVELNKIVEARQQRLERLRTMSTAARVADTEVNEAEAQLAEARARVLERQAQAMAAAGGEVLAALNQQLHLLAVDLAEMQTLQQVLSDRLEQYAKVIDHINQLDALEQARAKAAQAVAEQEQSLAELQQRQETLPQVYVHQSENLTAEQHQEQSSDHGAATEPTQEQ